MTDLRTLFEQSDMDVGPFVRAINHITGGRMRPSKLTEYLQGKRTLSQSVTDAAEVLVYVLLPLHDALMENEAYANMNPLVVAFANAVDADPQVMADYEWLVAARKADERLKLISHDILGLTLLRG